jgi:hypothetical protein
MPDGFARGGFRFIPTLQFQQGVCEGGEGESIRGIRSQVLAEFLFGEVVAILLLEEQRALQYR